MRPKMNAHHHQKGVAAVELALLLIPLITLAFGISEFGRAIYQYNAIAKGTRDAVRYLSTQTPGDSAARAAARCLVVFGIRPCPDEDPLPRPLVSGMDISLVTVRDSSSHPTTHSRQPISGGTGVANLVSVEVSGYKFSSLVTYVVPNLAFNTISATMFGPPP